MIVVFALYALSGACGLVLESVFLRQLALILGSTAKATSLVLSGFLGGLAIGAAVLGPAADRSSRPLALYGWLEIGAGLTGCSLAWLFGAGREVLLAPLRAAGTGFLERVLELLVALGCLLVPTVLMGGTLPALSRLVVREPARLIGPFGTLYGLNTLGGAAGVLVTGFYLFEHVGVARSAYLAGALSMAVGAAALLLARRQPPRIVPRDSGGSPRDPAFDEPSSSGAVRIACWVAAGLGGASVLGYEVLWTRLLILPMRSFSYSFSLMLSLFLLGLVLGSLVLSIAASRIREPVLLLGWVEVGMGAWVASSLLWLPSALLPPEGSSFAGLLSRASIRAALVVIPPTLLSGMALPLAIRALAPSKGRLAREVGLVYAVNTAGAIAGALAAGLLLLPLLGAPRSLALLAGTNALAGVIVIAARRPAGVRAWLALGLATLCALSVLLPQNRFVQAFLKASRGRERIAELLFFHEGTNDTIAVVKKDYGFYDPAAKSLVTNGVAMSATVKPVWRYMAVEGHLPVLLHPHPARVLVIGLGTGITLGAISSHPGLASIDAVELSEGVLRALPLFDAENDRAYLDPRVRLIHEDGRHLLEMTLSRYDVITLEPPPPIVAGSVHLYSLDFYRLARRRLEQGGVVAQWLPLHAQSLSSARMAARTFVDAFPYVQLWLPSVRDAVLVGSDRPIELDAARLAEAYRVPASRANLVKAFLETPEALIATFLLDREGVDRWAGDAPLITDERPRMEFFLGHGRNMEDRDIGTLLEIPQGEWLWTHRSGVDPRRIEEENRALRLYVRSEVEGRAERGIEAARLSRGTEFFLYPLGCATMQLEYLRQRADEKTFRVHSLRCAHLQR